MTEPHALPTVEPAPQEDPNCLLEAAIGHAAGLIGFTPELRNRFHIHHIYNDELCDSEVDCFCDGYSIGGTLPRDVVDLVRNGGTRAIMYSCLAASTLLGLLEEAGLGAPARKALSILAAQLPA